MEVRINISIVRFLLNRILIYNNIEARGHEMTSGLAGQVARV